MIHSATSGIRISGIVSAVPSHSISNESFYSNFGENTVTESAKMTGVMKRRRAQPETCTSDLCYEAADKLLSDLNWSRDSIQALVFVSQTADYILPATSCVLHDRLQLTKSCLTLDISLGCSGYVHGLYVVSNLMQSGVIKRALLLVGDTCSKFVSPQDKSTAMLFGDAGTATALEWTGNALDRMDFCLGSDGAGWKNLLISAGHFRQPSNSNTCQRQDVAEGIRRSLEDLYMNGGEIFNFTITAVPRMIRHHLQTIDKEITAIRSLVMHQANRFMLEHIRKKVGATSEQVPYSLEDFGNTSCASIPLTFSLHPKLSNQSGLTLMAGFGVGYSFATCSTIMNLNTCRIVEIP